MGLQMRMYLLVALLCVFRTKKATLSEESGRPFGVNQATLSE